MKRILTLSSIIICFNTLCTYAASYPTYGFGTEQSQAAFYEIETGSNTTDQSLLETIYNFDADFTEIGFDGTNPIYILSDSTELFAGDTINVLGTLYELTEYASTPYFWASDLGDVGLGETEPLFANAVPIEDNYIYILSLIGIYTVYKLQRKKNT